ncbi:MAG TPA: hypothetical protein VMT95_03180 [Candidatus Binatia bacterium]|nr:hypothetical protein [Candidatus Binatia bacterium]
MIISPFGRYAFGVLATVAVLSGCGGAQPPLGAPGAMHADHNGSRMRPNLSGQDLLYVTDGEIVKIYTYPRGKFVAPLGNFGSVYGMCSDAAGDVFIPEYFQNEILEYAHGGSSPIATINTIYDFPSGCSIDPTTGNLATATYSKLEVFRPSPSGWSLPTTYTDSDLGLINFCAYDGSGNLFVDGNDGSYQLAELPAGSSTFTNITLGKSINKPSDLMWDGHDIAIASGRFTGKFPAPIYQFSISGSYGDLVHLTLLFRAGGQLHQFWIQGDKIIGTHDGGEAIWNYPKGELATKLMRGVGGAVTVSVASSH